MIMDDEKMPGSPTDDENGATKEAGDESTDSEDM